jgi:competence ComEA-like helix-hairpin-helix protein
VGSAAQPAVASDREYDVRFRGVLLSVGLAIVLSGRSASAGKGIAGVVNLNTAPPEVLSLLPGVGPAKAAAILTYRKRRPFRTVDELVRIKGIGRKMVRRLRVHLAIAGPTTATAAADNPPVIAPGPAPKPAPHAPPPAAHPARPPLCSPPRALARPARAPSREHRALRPFSAPCLAPR